MATPSGGRVAKKKAEPKEEPKPAPKAPRARRKIEHDRPEFEPMHIYKFEAENIKRLKVVQIDPKGRVVEITGPNGSGKSSVLDTIMYALLGKDYIPAAPVRRGEQKANIKLDLGGVTVIRRFDTTAQEPAGYLEVWSNETKTKFDGPQTLLNSLLGKISFDPLQFKRMIPKQQIETLRTLVDVGIDLDEWDQGTEEQYEKRRVIGRELKVLKIKVAEYQVEAGLPDKPVSIEALTDQMQNAIAANSQRTELLAEVEELKRGEEAQTAYAAEQREEADEIRGKIKELEEQMARCFDSARAADKRVAEAVKRRQKIKVPEPVQTDEIALRIRAAETTNRKIQQRTERDKLQREHDEKQAEDNRLTDSIEKRRARKAELIAKADMPVPGLGFGEGLVLYNGLPLDQASDAEQIRVSVALGMASNPTIRVLCIRDGSLLDDKGLAQIGELAEQNNFQVWVERVDTSGKVGIVMQDGEVARAR